MAWLRRDQGSGVLARPDSRLAPAITSRRWRAGDDLGAMLLSSLVKFAIVIAIVGVIGYDGFSIAHTQVSVRDDAQQAAQVAHDALRNRATPQEAYAAAQQYATTHGSTIVANGFRVSTDGSVTLTLRATAPTFVAGRIPALHEYVSPTATGTAKNSIY